MRVPFWAGLVTTGVAAAILISATDSPRARAQTAPSPTGAPEPAPLALRDAIARAAAGNIQLLKQNVTLRTSEGNVTAALGQFDFVLAGDGTFSRSVNPPIGESRASPAALGAGGMGGAAGMAMAGAGGMAMAGAGGMAMAGAGGMGTSAASMTQDRNSGTSYTEVFNLSLTRALESGGNLTLALQGRGTTTTTPFACGSTATSTSCQIYSPSATLTFTQPVLRGFGREIAEANLRKARINKDLALLNRQAQAANTVRDTIIAYWELAYQTQDLEIQRFSEKLAREQLRTTEAQIQVGKMGELGAASVNRAIATAQQAEASSEQALMGRALDLQRLFGAAVPPSFVGYKAADALLASRHDVDVDAETRHALEASPALKSIRMGLKLSETDVLVALDSMRPQLNFTASVSQGGRNQDLGESLRQMSNPSYIEYSAGFNFSLPIENRAARGASEVARAAAAGAELDAHDLELSIRDTVARMAAQIRSAGARVEHGHEAVTYSEQNLKAEQARFQVGTSTNNDVLLRQQELRQAQESLARAMADLLEGDIALAALTGDVLDLYGITLR
jgi:outer membrane protein TolC